MQAAIVTCETLEASVAAAQQRMGMHYPVTCMDSSLHDRPNALWDAVLDRIKALPDEVDTVLLAMGLCGGTNVTRPFPRRTVMPRVDDCITLLLHTGQVSSPNLKEAGHFYLTGHPKMSIQRVRQSLLDKYGEQDAAVLMDMWFRGYRSVDVIDTGLYDSRCAEFQGFAQREADAIGVPWQYVPGSNCLLERLVSGCWEERFLVLEQGDSLSAALFLE